MDSTDLERDIDAALRTLPPPSAPLTLVAHVMREVRDARDAQETRGWLRPWFAWAPGAQVSAALALMAGALAFAWFSGDIVDWAQSLTSATPVAAGRLVWRAIEPAVVGGAVYVLVMGVVATCVAAALTHVALEGTPNS